jgi:L-ascorbate metabolism protein UlaG (beta-lactamase superfamily)
MQITKHEHACLVLEEGGDRLVFDPGSFTSPLDDARGVLAIVVTHEHPDHWTPEQLRRVLEHNPEARIISTQAVADAVRGEELGVEVEVPRIGDELEIGPFSLRFLGGRHAVIHSSIPVIDNLAVLVNGTLLHPGDSLTVPEFEVDTLAIPLSAPWLKIAEAMDYLAAVKPTRAFPIHEVVYSQAGQAMGNARLEHVAGLVGTDYRVLTPGESLAI